MSAAPVAAVAGSRRRPAHGRQGNPAAPTGSGRSGRQSRTLASRRSWARCMAASITAALAREILRARTAKALTTPSPRTAIRTLTESLPVHAACPFEGQAASTALSAGQGLLLPLPGVHLPALHRPRAGRRRGPGFGRPHHARAQRLRPAAGAGHRGAGAGGAASHGGAARPAGAQLSGLGGGAGDGGADADAGPGPRLLRPPRRPDASRRSLLQRSAP